MLCRKRIMYSYISYVCADSSPNTISARKCICRVRRKWKRSSECMAAFTLAQTHAANAYRLNTRLNDWTRKHWAYVFDLVNEHGCYDPSRHVWFQWLLGPPPLILVNNFLLLFWTGGPNTTRLLWKWIRWIDVILSMVNSKIIKQPKYFIHGKILYLWSCKENLHFRSELRNYSKLKYVNSTVQCNIKFCTILR